MIFTDTPLPGAYIVEMEPHGDHRGFFARTFCRQTFAERGLQPLVEQANVSFNYLRGTLRGLHFQYPPSAEAKFVHCTRGAIVDVIVDLRPESPTWLQSIAVELSAANRRGLYVPERFAHGYQTLEDETETTYLVSASHDPAAEGGLRYSDPRLDIEWPLPVAAISQKDRGWPPLAAIETVIRRRMAVRPLVEAG